MKKFLKGRSLQTTIKERFKASGNALNTVPHLIGLDVGSFRRQSVMCIGKGSQTTSGPVPPNDTEEYGDPYYWMAVTDLGEWTYFPKVAEKCMVV